MFYPDNYVNVTRLLKTQFWCTDICSKPSYKNATSSIYARSYFCISFSDSLHSLTRNCFFAQGKKMLLCSFDCALSSSTIWRPSVFYFGKRITVFCLRLITHNSPSSQSNHKQQAYPIIVMSASRYVCHNPDCGSRRQSFSNEKGYTMHFALSPSCLSFIDQSSSGGDTRHQPIADDVVFVSTIPSSLMRRDVINPNTDNMHNTQTWSASMQPKPPPRTPAITAVA